MKKDKKVDVVDDVLEKQDTVDVVQDAIPDEEPKIAPVTNCPGCKHCRI